jgi:uracil DNA glycosylase
MNSKKFESKFKTWYEKLKPFIESEEFEEIFVFLKALRQQNIEISPSSYCLFQAFRNVNIYDLKCVIIGENPYNNFENEEPIDTGVLFGSRTRIQPNLQEFYNGLEKELYNGLNLNIIYNYDLDYLTSQGILMIPSSFTIEKNAKKGHNKIWKPFMEFLLKEIIAHTGVPILFLGKSKQYMHLVEKSNYCYHLPMPLFGNVWDTKEVFSEINKNVWDSNEDTIMWLDVEVPF